MLGSGTPGLQKSSSGNHVLVTWTPAAGPSTALLNGGGGRGGGGSAGLTPSRTAGTMGQYGGRQSFLQIFGLSTV